MQPTTPNAMLGRGITWELESESPQASPPASPPTSRVVLPVTVDVGVRGIHWELEESSQASAPTSRVVLPLNVEGRGTHWELEESPTGSRSTSPEPTEDARRLLERASLLAPPTIKKVRFSKEVFYRKESRDKPTETPDDPTPEPSDVIVVDVPNIPVKAEATCIPSMLIPVKNLLNHLSSHQLKKPKSPVLPIPTLRAFISCSENNPNCPPNPTFLNALLLSYPRRFHRPSSSRQLLRELAKLAEQAKAIMAIKETVLPIDIKITSLLEEATSQVIFGCNITNLHKSDALESRIYKTAMSDAKMYGLFCKKMSLILSKLEELKKVVFPDDASTST